MKSELQRIFKNKSASTDEASSGQTASVSSKEREKMIIKARQDEICAMYQSFLKGKGKLPEGFSEPYVRYQLTHSGTPFEEYLDWIKNDFLRDESGISEWLFFDGSADINAASEQIAEWKREHGKMNDIIREKCHVGQARIMSPVDKYGTKKTMVVVEDGSQLRNIREESVQALKETEISFCTITSVCSLYDLFEQREKKIAYEEYPNYHDETYTNWWLE